MVLLMWSVMNVVFYERGLLRTGLSVQVCCEFGLL